jgi:hypothetical protein
MASLAACGGGEKPRIRDTVNGWIGAVVRHDNARACDRLSSTLRKRIERHLLGEGTAGSCNTWAARWVSPRHPASHRAAHIASIRIDGGRATVALTAPGAVPGQVTLVKERGRWRIDNW